MSMRGVRGREPRRPKSARGQAFLGAILSQGLSLEAAAKKAGISYPTLAKLIHDEPDRATVGVVEAVCKRLSIPLDVVAPGLAKLTASALKTAV